jgi:hypothetical protein
LGCELVAFARRCRYRHRETVLNDPRDVPFQPAQVIDIGDNAFAGLADHRRDQRHAAGGHIHHLARELAQREQQHFELDRVAVFVPAAGAGDRAGAFVGQDRQQTFHGGPIGRSPKIEE